MKCQNHPAAPAIEKCATCDTPLCGMCCTFADEGAYCEKCFKALESKKKCEEQIARREEPRSNIVYEDLDSANSKKASESAKDKMVVWGVIIAFVAIGAVQLYRYGNPSGVGLSPAEEARNQQLVSMVQCAAVYRQIGILIAEDRNVPGDLRCAAQQSPHVVTRSGEVVKYAHPNPQMYGYAEISVSSNNPQPNMVMAVN